MLLYSFLFGEKMRIKDMKINCDIGQDIFSFYFLVYVIMIFYFHQRNTYLLHTILKIYNIK